MKPTVCPICGGPLGKPYTLLDGEICENCAEDLRFRYPFIYLPRVGMLDQCPQCQQLRRKDLTLLKKNRREAFFRTGSGKKLPSYQFDPMMLLTLDQFRQQLTDADAREDRIREDYLDYTNVLTVDYSRALRRTIGKKGIQNLRRRKTAFCVTGYIRAGAFREGDMVWILHQGHLRYADILAMEEELLTPDPEYGETRTDNAEQLGDRGDQGRCFRAGHQVTMVLSQRAQGIEDGDWIVSD